jgi:hypothetical protein
MHWLGDTLLVAGVPAVVVLFAVQFVALRIRDARATPQDPHLGRKALLYFFVNAGVFLALIGLTISSADWVAYLFEEAITAQQQQRANPAPNQPPAFLQPPPVVPPVAPPPRDWFNDQQRLAAGLVTSGFLYGVLFWLIARVATNDKQFPAVRRAFAAVRLLVAGVVVVTLGTVAIVQAFQRGETDFDQVATEIGIAVVWGPTAVLHMLLLLRTSGWRAAQADA